MSCHKKPRCRPQKLDQIKGDWVETVGNEYGRFATRTSPMSFRGNRKSDTGRKASSATMRGRWWGEKSKKLGKESRSSMRRENEEGEKNEENVKGRSKYKLRCRVFESFPRASHPRSRQTLNGLITTSDSLACVPSWPSDRSVVDTFQP